MQLTDNHIQQLYTFTQKHYVEHYDVQAELVDHLANDIENIITENPTLNFEKARDIAFKKFGVFGFMDVVDAKRTQLGKKYTKILFSFLKDWFKLPKIIVTLAIFMVIYSLSKYSFANTFFTYTSLIVFIIGLIRLFSLRKLSDKKFKITGKSLMFEDMIKNQGMGNIVFISSYFFYLSAPSNALQTLTQQIVLSILFTLILLIAYISFFLIPRKSDELIKKHYPKVILN